MVWFDAHGDANTPETTDSGFLDGMPVAILAGRCWRILARSVPGFVPIPSKQVLLAGVRSIDEQEREFLGEAEIPLIEPAGLEQDNGAAFTTALASLSQEVSSIHVHVDLDVIDTSDGIANEFAADGGPSLDTLVASINRIGGRAPVNSLSLTSYNPACDDDQRAERSALRLLDALATLVPSS